MSALRKLMVRHTKSQQIRGEVRSPSPRPTARRCTSTCRPTEAAVRAARVPTASASNSRHSTIGCAAGARRAPNSESTTVGPTINMGRRRPEDRTPMAPDQWPARPSTSRARTRRGRRRRRRSNRQQRHMTEREQARYRRRSPSSTKNVWRLHSCGCSTTSARCAPTSPTSVVVFSSDICSSCWRGTLAAGRKRSSWLRVQKTPPVKRHKLIKDFQDEGGHSNWVTYATAAVGITLTAAASLDGALITPRADEGSPSSFVRIPREGEVVDRSSSLFQRPPTN